MPRGIPRPGASVDSEELLRPSARFGMTAAPMVRYFEPLTTWLREKNPGRRRTLADM